MKTTRGALALLGSISWAAIAASAPATAQSQAASEVDVNEIVVTANKREQNLNKVGLTVTAISGEALAERGITSLQDVAAAVPGLAFAPSANNTPILTLRGIGFNESSLGVYPAVSVYVDQAPLPFPVLASHSAYDLERIEVLKGPQGTLFGQNSTGGAINYIAAKPTDAFAAGGDISYGRFNQIEGNAYVSGPIAPDMRARLAVTGLSADGWQYSNTRPGDKNGKQSYVAGRFLLDWDASEAFRFSVNVNAWHDTGEPQAAQFILMRPQTPSTVPPQQLTYPFTAENPRAADWSTGELTPQSNRKFIQGALRADLDLTDDISVTSLTSYADYDQTQTTDGDGSSLNVTDLQADTGTIKSFNQELRIANASRSQFRWVLGANYEKSKTFESQRLRYVDGSNSSAPLNFINDSITLNRQNIENYAVFGNLEYELGSGITLKGAARYTKSRNKVSICGNDSGDGRINGLFNGLGAVLGTVPFTPISNASPSLSRCYALDENLVPGTTPYLKTLSEDNVSWRAGIDYQASNSVLVYANISRGYKAGSFPILAAATETQYNPVTQESVTAYEAGVKAGFWDRKAQFNAAIFYYDYKDKQVLGKVLDPVFGILDTLTNVPKSRVLGLEAELTLRPVDGLTLAGSVTYLDTEIRNYTGVDYIGNTRSFRGEPLPFTPKWNYAANIDYRFSNMGGGAPFVGVSVSGHSASDTVPGGNSIVIAPAPTSRILPGLVHPFTTPPYATVDARLGYEADGGAWKFMAWTKNMFDKYYWTNVVTASDYSARYAGRPATYGVTVSFAM